ncbi:MAG: endonuclease III [Nitrospirales bacterium]|nr:endonuclease III [Nitrospira sp.]MDR4500187.1 endonuclease III [Nitrospirales bacterium]
MTASRSLGRRPSYQEKAGSRSRTRSLKVRAQQILKALEEAIPIPEVELSSSNPLELLIATILSAQCTDERVNRVTPALFSRFRSAEAFAQADPQELEALIRSTGFYKSKAKNIMACGEAVATRYDGVVPDSMEELTSLPGVGRKTANVLLGSYFKKPAIVVDTHVKRVSNRLNLTQHHDPTMIEYDLQKLLPPSQWTVGAQRLLLHGRYVCQARLPKCGICPIYELCHWSGKLSDV